MKRQETHRFRMAGGHFIDGHLPGNVIAWVLSSLIIMAFAAVHHNCLFCLLFPPIIRFLDLGRGGGLCLPQRSRARWDQIAETSASQPTALAASGEVPANRFCSRMEGRVAMRLANRGG
jgi:hypothetical protein